ncbi:hypothetical protein ATL41_2199 [Flavimobilis soli]|uniref:Uncharacterized protein n=2 Tax=Flavimobilis soli TaxID=442709 RepID=A0A2A9EEG6_9MICO|nr:hypothetical protein ATL41_2199 [Flavimobilis soli]
MARVRREHGPTARIVKAERVRSGGIGGFFAREYFEVTVDVPDPSGVDPRTTARVPEVPRPRVRGIADLLDAADDAERGAVERSATGAQAHRPVDGPALSTTGETFASVLDSVRSLAVGTGVVSEPEGFVPARPRTVSRDDVVLTRASDAPTARAAGDGRDERTDVRQEAFRLDPDAPEVVPATAVGTAKASVVTRSSGSTVTELLDVGVPIELLREVAGHVDAAPGLRLPLSEIFMHVPRAPRPLRKPGAIVVVAGAGQLAVDAARVIARRLGITEADVALAGDFTVEHGAGRWVISAAAARKLATDAGRAGLPLVVALCVSSERYARAEAADFLEDLDADQLWAAVEADRSAKDTTRWLKAVGRQLEFDALAVSKVAESSSPAQVLSYGVPVGFLDGLPASAPVWAATLAEHLEDAVWD